MFVLFTLVVPFTGLCTDTLTFVGLLYASEMMAVFHIDTLTFRVIEYFFLRRWQCYIFNLCHCYTFLGGGLATQRYEAQICWICEKKVAQKTTHHLNSNLLSHVLEQITPVNLSIESLYHYVKQR